MPTAVSLFSGCGGSDTGAHRAGFNILMANDILPYAREVYLANLPETDYKLCDVSQIDSFPSADVLLGCYPCQGFSQGGVRDPSRNINYLYREFDRALRKIKPKAFIVENVSGMSRSNFQHLLNNQLVRFRLAGYRVEWGVLDARNYGVPQERKRLFIVGIRSDIGIQPRLPEPTHGFGTDKPYVTIREALKGLPLWPDGGYYDYDFHWYYLSRNRYRGWNEQSKTIVSNPRHTPLHPASPQLVKHAHNDWRFERPGPSRRFTYVEASRLQGFSKKMRFPECPSLDMKFRVVGNAVPPQLFEAVAKSLPDIW
jgi:DNA (cytosine-5)-methyltransferase 1